MLTTVEHHSWDGEVRVVDGEIRVAETVRLRRCDLTVEKTRLHCGGCGHHWHPRRPVGMPYDPKENGSGSRGGTP